MNLLQTALLLSACCLVVAGCERPATDQPPDPVETTSASPSVAAEQAEVGTTETESLGAVEETPRARALAIGAALPPDPTRTEPLENAAAEGAMAQIWERDGQVQKVVFEFKGETYDRLHTIYFENGAPLFARFYEHFDPAKMLSPGDEGYAEGVAARQVEVVRVTYLPGDAKEIESATVEVSTAATYEGGSLVEMRPLPETKPPRLGDHLDLIRETEKLLDELR